MTARVLVVDDIPTNVKLLEARLSAEYFDVLTATCGPEALDILSRERVDIVLLDVMMPGMDGFAVCRMIKADPRTHHIPVIMVTALDEQADRIQGLESGADDFLTKPVDDVSLVTRVKNLTRIKVMHDEMLMRAVTDREMGITENKALEHALNAVGGRVLVVEDKERSLRRLVDALGSVHQVVAEPDPARALERIKQEQYDLLLISLGLEEIDGLRLCTRIRSFDHMRYVPIVILVDSSEDARLLRGLEMGVNDYILRPVERHELVARVQTQIKRKRHSDYFRRRLDQSVEAAITDGLTGLYNRRYMESHMETLLEEAKRSQMALSVLLVDIDHFKTINDTLGHDAGDLVLREFAGRFSRNTRGCDLACRLGGEEFLLIMPDATLRRAYQVGERFRACVAAEPFSVADGEPVRITASVGIATCESETDTPKMILKRADMALYAAKRRGRNRVSADAA